MLDCQITVTSYMRGPHTLRVLMALAKLSTFLHWPQMKFLEAFEGISSAIARYLGGGGCSSVTTHGLNVFLPRGVNIIFLISNFHHSSLRHSTSYSRGPACTTYAMRLHHAVDLTEWSAGNNFKDPSCLHIWCPLTLWSGSLRRTTSTQ